MKGINTSGQVLPLNRYCGLFRSKLRGISTFRFLHSHGNGTTALSRSTHSFENKPEFLSGLLTEKMGYYPPNMGTTARRTPAATAEPITPATLGPMACMSR